MELFPKLAILHISKRIVISVATKLIYNFCMICAFLQASPFEGFLPNSEYNRENVCQIWKITHTFFLPKRYHFHLRLCTLMIPITKLWIPNTHVYSLPEKIIRQLKMSLYTLQCSFLKKLVVKWYVGLQFFNLNLQIMV